MNKAKEKMLRLMLDEFRTETSEGEWITPLNPDNIKIEFVDMGEVPAKSFGRHKIYLNNHFDVAYLFPCYVRELWYIKQKREQFYKYWLYKLFNYAKLVKPAQEHEQLAKNWICG